MSLQQPRSSSTRFHTPWLIFWVAFAVRALYATLGHVYRFKAYNEHFQFGWEMGRIARALASGYGYSDPFTGHTGPTAWVPPLFPLLLAGIFKIFGIYSLQSGWVIVICNSFFSALTALTTWEIGARCFNFRVAKWSGWIWALYPAAMQYIRWVWEISLTTCLFSLVLVLSLRMREIGEDPTAQKREPSLKHWLLFGLLWGAIALSNSTLLLFLPVCGLWIVVGTKKRALACRRALLSALVFLCCITPWFIRNWEAFHAFVPMRSNLGVELWAWNKPYSNGIGLGAPIEPDAHDPRFQAYARLGELNYSRQQGELAKAYIRTHPGTFTALSIKRFYFFWFSVPHPVDNKPWAEGLREVSFNFLSLAGLLGLGLAMKERKPAAGLFLWAFILLPLTYYFVDVQARFRHPLEPLIAVLGVYLFQSAKSSRRPVAAQLLSD